MNAEEFAVEFINDLPDTLEHMDINKSFFSFNADVYLEDPELKVLKSKLNEINFDLVPTQIGNLSSNAWKLIKLN